MHNTALRRAAVGGPMIFLLLLSYRTAGSDRVRAQIIDERTSQPIAATLVIADGEGHILEIEGKHPHVEYLGKRRCYVDGTFALAVHPSRLIVEIRRGLETLPLKAEVDLTREKSDPLTFKLQRWVDMSQHGYLSGDSHVHLLSQSESHFQMSAEDLHVVNLL